MCAYNDADDEDDENDDDDDDNDEGGVVTTARRPATLLQRGVQRYCPCRMTGCARAFAAHPGPLKEPSSPHSDEDEDDDDDDYDDDDDHDDDHVFFWARRAAVLSHNAAYRGYAPAG